MSPSLHSTKPPAPEDVLQELAALDEKYRSCSAEEKPEVSAQIETNPTLGNILRLLHPLECQLCHCELFRKRGRSERYSEIHHLAELPSGQSWPSDNCVVVCANCHKKMHCGEVEIEDAGQAVRIRDDRLPGTARVVYKTPVHKLIAGSRETD